MRPSIAVPVASTGPSPAIGIGFAVCFIIGLLFLIAGAIAIGLIPVYLSRGDSRARTATTTPVTNPNLLFYAVTSQNQLLTINTQNPSVILSSVPLTGLTAGDIVNNIDFRPAFGVLYGTSNGQLYVINETTGAARAIGTPLNTATNGNIISMEFSPVTDLLRIVTMTSGTFDVNPETGVIETSSVQNNERRISVAFNNNLAGASTSTLFILDPTMDALFRQNPPIDLSVPQVGSGFGINAIESQGFDIAPNGLAIACLNVSNTLSLFSVNLNSGTLSRNLGPISQPVVSIAIPTVPVAYGITSADKKLLIVNSLDSGLSFVSKTITGLDAGETIQSIDVRPLNVRLYGVSTNNRLFVVDPGAGGVELVGTAPITPTVQGTTFSIDFNPTVDRIRVVSNTSINLRVNPDTAVAITDGNLNPGTPSITAIAYTNNFAGATNTVLYDIDNQRNQLFIQNPPNGGALVNVGSLGVTPSSIGGFDIGGKTGIALAVLTINSVTSVYRIDLNTGAATSVSNTVFPEIIISYALSLNR
ncbi:hypothetical protein I4U23_000203 [Adineta vaga]|nr:hypothetical protein I4U23_000203 [Adineta vaga]